MLVYNFQKEFIGIDESDLRILGFQNLEQLRAESADFANLFVKTPGFVHNFTHIHWIDYVASASSYEESKAIIHTKDQDYKCNLDIKIIYLVDNPAKKAYLIDLVNLRAVSTDELEQIKLDIKQKSAPQATNEKQKLFQNQDLDKKPKTIPEIITKTAIQKDNVIQLEPVLEIDTKESTYIQENIDKSNLEQNPKIDLNTDENKTETFIEMPIELPKISKKVQKKETKTSSKKDKNIYIYNPQLASDELGLPIDLIKEFLEDFISQAAEFKGKLYVAIENEDIKNAQTLAHKLKGVAANLRIEDALEVLTIANTSDSLSQIKINVDKFYKIMSKLSIDNSSMVTKEKVTEKITTDNNDYDESLFINFDDD